MGTPSYESAGVRDQDDALSSVVRHLQPTLALPRDARTLTRFGQYASVLEISEDIAIAISTDGVGSKTIIASRMDRYDTIGFDCVAMNVNDVICVGATPIAMVDYLGVHTLDTARTDAILKGLAAAAAEASIAIPGGELAQLPEVIGSDGRTPGDEKAFDLVGTCVGVVHPAKLMLGGAVAPGDAIIGVASSGIHSNGLTLARKVLLDDAGYGLGDEVPQLNGTLGDELLRPTAIYVKAARALWDAGVDTRGLVHITSDGFTNLCRLDAPVGYRIDWLPEVPPIFALIRDQGGVDDTEMFRVFNMGVGLVVIVPQEDAERSIGLIEQAGYTAWRLGVVDEDAGTVTLEPAGLTGKLVDGASRFSRS
ncbi:MAG: phosphoribosylformylglycinamidine cyclo-ligase [Actinomycetota bacterium]